MLVKCLQQQIINILVRNYNITPSEAYDKWYRAIAKKDDRIAEIIDNLIHASPEGIPVLINRNPKHNWEIYSRLILIMLYIEIYLIAGKPRTGNQQPSLI